MTLSNFGATAAILERKLSSSNKSLVKVVFGFFFSSFSLSFSSFLFFLFLRERGVGSGMMMK